LPRAVRSGEGAGSIGRAADAVSYKNLGVLSVWGADKHHAEVDQWNERRQDRRLLATVDGGGARENASGLVLELAFEPEATRAVYKLLHLRAHVAIAGAGQQRRRDLKAERLRSLEVDHKLILGWRLHRKVGRLLALEDAIDVAGRTSVPVDLIRTVGDQTA